MTWATCELCNREMKIDGGCLSTITIVGVDGKKYKRLKNEDYTCHDCNAGFGKYHHKSCDMERCPICRQQLLSCECWTHYEVKTRRKA